MNSNQLYMQLAINKAWQYQGLTYPNPAVGALVVHNNEIIALEAHQKAGTSHAEVLALIKAYEILSKQPIPFDRFNAHQAHTFLYALPKDFFSECIIYVTLEPCSHIGKTPSCASLLAHIKPKKVVIATLDPIKGHDGGIKRLQEQGIAIDVGVCETEAKALIEPFIIWQKRAFILFKIAQTSNGKIGGGYLSSRDSLTHVHQLRAVCTRMVIGGNTVRVDRPTLDCRFSLKGVWGDKAPDITIFSRRNDFDRTIPLFTVPERTVTVGDTIDWGTPSFILVEGGEGMLSALADKIDWVLQYQTPKFSSHDLDYGVDMDLAFLYQDAKGVDLMLWSRVHCNAPL